MVNEYLLNYFEKNLKKNFSIDQIKDICLKNNFNREQIDEVIIFLNKKNQNKKIIKIILITFLVFFIIIPLITFLTGFLMYKSNSINVELDTFSEIHSQNSGINHDIIHFYVRYLDPINNNIKVSNGNIILNAKNLSCKYDLSGKNLKYEDSYRLELKCNRNIEIGEMLKGSIKININGIEKIGSFRYPVNQNNITISKTELLVMSINKRINKNLEEIKKNSYSSNESLSEYEEYFRNKTKK